jgi:hypothetical protein
MIPDTRTRLESALAELQAALVRAGARRRTHANLRACGVSTQITCLLRAASVACWLPAPVHLLSYHAHPALRRSTALTRALRAARSRQQQRSLLLKWRRSLREAPAAASRVHHARTETRFGCCYTHAYTNNTNKKEELLASFVCCAIAASEATSAALSPATNAAPRRVLFAILVRRARRARRRGTAR